MDALDGCIGVFFSRLLLVESQAEVLAFAFGAYMFESLESFNNSQVKAHSMFFMSKLKKLCH